MVHAAGREPHGLSCVTHRHGAVQFLACPLDDLAHPAVRFGRTNVSRDTRRDLAPRCDKLSYGITRMLEHCLEERQTLTEVSRREFAITETEDSAIAPAEIIGDRRSPVIG